MPFFLYQKEMCQFHSRTTLVQRGSFVPTVLSTLHLPLAPQVSAQVFVLLNQQQQHGVLHFTLCERVTLVGSCELQQMFVGHLRCIFLGHRASSVAPISNKFDVYAQITHCDFLDDSDSVSSSFSQFYAFFTRLEWYQNRLWGTLD